MAVRPDSFNVISLCTGGGGLDLGVGLAVPSARSVVYVEREAFAVAHLVDAIRQGSLGDAPVWSDVTTFNGRPWRGSVDCLIGGIPCQPHSLAGLRLAEDDERDLWSHARRIIVQSRPRVVFIENVGGFVTSGGLYRVWRDFRRLGYESEVGLFTASEVGASHRRERCFVLAVADHNSNGQRWGEESHRAKIKPGQQASRRRDAERRDLNVADAHGEHDDRRRDAGARWRPQPANGNGDVADAGRSGLQGSERRGSSEQRHGAAASRSASELRGASLVHPDRAEWGADVGRRHVVNGGDEGRNEAPSRIRESGAVVDAARERQYPEGLGLFAPGPARRDEWRSIIEAAPFLEPAVCRMADGLASGLDFARVDRLRLLGNGVVPLEAAYAFRTLATRLAERASDAAFLVRLMEAA